MAKKKHIFWLLVVGTGFKGRRFERTYERTLGGWRAVRNENALTFMEVTRELLDLRRMAWAWEHLKEKNSGLMA